jgi:hypothetical protein
VNEWKKEEETIKGIVGWMESYFIKGSPTFRHVGLFILDTIFIL